MTAEDDERLGILRARAFVADRALRAAVIAACPGPHVIDQHRDARPPWCSACGRTASGFRAEAMWP